MTYVDGFVLPVPKKKLQAYRKMARAGGKSWIKHGALEFFECVGDDLNPKWAGIKFPKTVRVKPNEKVVFSFIIFKSKADRNRVNAKVMKEFESSSKNMEMPFDMRRMAYGGFNVLVGLQTKRKR